MEPAVVDSKPVPTLEVVYPVGRAEPGPITNPEPDDYFGKRPIM
jgi:hypothetical protein